MKFITDLQPIVLSRDLGSFFGVEGEPWRGELPGLQSLCTLCSDKQFVLCSCCHSSSHSLDFRRKRGRGWKRKYGGESGIGLREEGEEGFASIATITASSAPNG